MGLHRRFREVMKVGLISPEFPPDIGGVETYSFELARALVRHGYDVTVFTMPHVEGEVSLPGARILPQLTLRRRLDRDLLEQTPMDVWHATNAAYSWIGMERKNVVVSVHGNDFLRPYVNVERPDLPRLPGLWRFAERLDGLDKRIGKVLTARLMTRAMPQVSKLVANSRYTESMLLDKFPACAGRTYVGLVGVGDGFFLVPPIPRKQDEPTRLLTVCRLSEPRKNVDRVLQALTRLKDKHRFSYSVVGEGELRPGLEALARQLGIGDRVTFTGRVSSSAIERWLASSDLFVLASSILPTSHEGFGIVYLEANACGVPVLAARLAGAAEAVAEGVSGMFVEQPTVDALTEALDHFLTGAVKFDPNTCRQHAKGFIWDRVVERLAPLYKDVSRISPAA